MTPHRMPLDYQLHPKMRAKMRSYARRTAVRRHLKRLVRALRLASTSLHFGRVYGLGAFGEYGHIVSEDFRTTTPVLFYKVSLGPWLATGILPLWLAQDYKERIKKLQRDGKLGSYGSTNAGGQP